MRDMEAGHRRLEYVGFVVDLDRGEVLRDGHAFRLRPKTLRVLEHFVRHAGRLVSREELMEAVWPHTVVTEDSLTQCVAEIRRSLGNGGRAALRTIARRGYLFDARRVDPGVPTAPVAELPARVPAARRNPSRALAFAGVLALSAVGVLAALQGAGDRGEVHAAAPRSVAPPDAADGLAPQLYSVGRHLFLRRGPGDLEWAERHLERAVRLDPGHAAAWTTLAAVYAARGTHDRGDRMYRLVDRRAALERALVLDPGDAEALVRKARLLADLGETEASQRAFAAAMEMDAENPTVLATRSTRALLAGDIDSAVALTRRAVEREPLAAVYRYNYGRLLLATGEAREALEQMAGAMHLSPQIADTRIEMARSLWLLGHVEAAQRTLRDVPAGLARDQMSVLLAAVPEATSGESRLRADPDWTSPILLAEIAAHRGEADTAFAYLDEALQRWWSKPSLADCASSFLLELATAPLLRSLHDDERWRQLLAQLEVRTA